jgi:hypothetical protein
MSLRRARQPKLRLWHAVLIIALPSACATEVQQEFDDDGDPSDAGSGSGGALVTGGNGGVIPMPKAGSSSGGSGGSGVSPFGGTSSTGGNASSGSGGMSEGGTDSGGSGGSGGKTTGGSGGASAGSGGASAGTGGGGSGPCGCMKTLAWADNTVLNWSTGDCLTVDDATYKYVGTKMQTWANKDCNPTAQLAWCTDGGNDYKFMLCQ